MRNYLLLILASACPLLAAPAPIVIDGSDHTLLLDPRGRVCALELSTANYADWKNNTANVLDAEDMSARVYEHFNDDFDFIVFLNNKSSGSGGKNWAVQNDVQGLGRSLVDYTGSYSSAGKLQSVIHLTSITALTNGPSLHEIMHRWANYMFTISSSGHWGYSSVGGQLGGWQEGTLTDNGDGTYDADGPSGSASFSTIANGGNSIPYSTLELYLMGLVPVTDVPDITVAVGASFINSTGGFSASSLRTVSQSDITTFYGARNPDHTTSQKAFRAIVVILTDGPISESSWDSADSRAQTLAFNGADASSLYNFYEATGGRATLQMDNLLETLPAGNEGLTLSSNEAFNSEILGDTPPTPSTTDYSILNENSVSIPWAVSGPAWIDFSASSGTLAPGEDITLTLTVNSTANSLADGLHSSTVRINNTNNDVYSEFDVSLSITDLIFQDDFEAETLGGDWVVSGTNEYRVRVTPYLPFDGNQNVVLDDGNRDTAYSRTELTLTLDLEGWSNVVLQFDAREYFDASNSPPSSPFTDGANFDGVAVSPSTSSNQWWEVQSLRSLSSEFRTITVHLDDFLDSDNGLDYSDSFQIRFNQYGRDSAFIAYGDGIGIDNVRITGSPPGVPYQVWAQNSGLTSGINDGLTQDPDGDGRSNLEEFAFNSNPTDGNDSNKSAYGFEMAEGEHLFSITIPAREGASFIGPSPATATIDGITYTIRGAYDLDAFTANLQIDSSPDTTGLDALSAGWSYQRFLLSNPTSLPTGFLKVEISEEAPHSP